MTTTPREQSSRPLVSEESEYKPVADKGPWVVNPCGKSLQSDDFTHDVALAISGDFADEMQRVAYAQGLAAMLNDSATALAQRDAEIADLQREIGGWMLACNEARDKLAAAKELLRELAPYIKGHCEIHCKALCESGCSPAELMVRYDAFLQEKK